MMLSGLRKMAWYRYRVSSFFTRNASRWIAVFLIFSLFVVLYYRDISIPGNLMVEGHGSLDIKSDQNLPDTGRFYSQLFRALKKYEPLERPEVDAMRDGEKCKSGDITKTPSEEMFHKASYKNLDSCMHLSQKYLRNLKKNHEGFVRAIHQYLEVSEEDAQKLWPNKRGIVTIGGSRFSVISLSMLETLREMGSTLPVEVIIPPEDEGDTDYCENVLPKLNAKCVFFSDVLSPSLIGKFPIKRYQYKLIGLLISSFQEILFLDADCLPLKNVDTVFGESLYHDRGLILWPDMWRRATSPAFYEIAGINVDMTQRVRNLVDDVSPVSRYENSESRPNYLWQVPFHDMMGTMPDPSSESGQLVVNKVRHISTLLLATYYNIHSEWYYRLLSQGTSGEGDKETFLAAAYALKMPHYQVKTDLSLDGFIDYKNDYHGISLYQHDFQQDFNQHQRAKEHVQNNIEEYSKFNPDYSSDRDYMKSLMKPENGNDVRASFAHVGYHKFEPFEMFSTKVYMDQHDKHFRAFGNHKALRGFDLELFNFGVYKKYLCDPDSPPIDFKYYRSTINFWKHSQMCEYIKTRVEFLQDTHDEFMKKANEVLASSI